MTTQATDTDVTAAVCLFRGLADPARLAIVRHLALGEHRVVDLTAHLGLAQSTVSGHLSCLRDCGLVTARAEGRASLYYYLKAWADPPTRVISDPQQRHVVKIRSDEIDLASADLEDGTALRLYSGVVGVSGDDRTELSEYCAVSLIVSGTMPSIDLIHRAVRPLQDLLMFSLGGTRPRNRSPVIRRRWQKSGLLGGALAPRAATSSSR